MSKKVLAGNNAIIVNDDGSTTFAMGVVAPWLYVNGNYLYLEPDSYGGTFTANVETSTLSFGTTDNLTFSTNGKTLELSTTVNCAVSFGGDYPFPVQSDGYLKSTSGVLSWASVTVPTGANPTASVGLTAVNGSAATFLRSDGAPALDVSIAPTWTGAHTFTNATPITISNTAPKIVLTDTTASAKSLTIAVDANVANIRESAGASASLLVFDLANNQVGIGKNPASVKLDILGTTDAYIWLTGVSNIGYGMTCNSNSYRTFIWISDGGNVYYKNNTDNGGVFKFRNQSNIDVASISYGAPANSFFVDTSGAVGFGTGSPSTQLHTYQATATTNAVVNLATWDMDTTGTAAASFGLGHLFRLESSTTAQQDAARNTVFWTDATHATRTSAMTWELVNSAAALAEVMRLTPTTLTLTSTAPVFTMTDSTASAKSLTIAVDANVANFRESAGASGSLLALDLANNKAAIGTVSFVGKFNSVGTNAAADAYPIYARSNYVPTAGQETSAIYGFWMGTNENGYAYGVTAYARQSGSSTNSSMVGGIFTADCASSDANGTVTTAYGGQFIVKNNSYGTWTNAYAGYFECKTTGVSPGVITNAYGLYVIAPSNSSTATIVNSYGLYIGNHSIGTSLNYSIYTNAGLNRFGDQVSVVGSADRQQLIVTGHSTQAVATGLVGFTRNDATAGVSSILALTGLGSGANADGISVDWFQKSSTTAAQQMAVQSMLWTDATHASRTPLRRDALFYAGTALGKEFAWSRSGCSNTSVTIVPDLANYDIATAATFLYQIKQETSGEVQGSVMTMTNNSTALAFSDGTNEYTLTCGADGSLTGARTAGTVTFTVMLSGIYY